MTMSTDAHSETPTSCDDAYARLLQGLQTRMLQIHAIHPGPLFTTDATAHSLFEAFLDALPPSERKYHDCRACRRFTERFGGLVAIGADGNASSVFWDPEVAPAFYRTAVQAVARRVARARVDGVFLSGETEWGVARTVDVQAGKEWQHFAVTPPTSLVRTPSLTATDDQAIATVREDRKVLARSLSEFRKPIVAEAVRLLSTGALPRPETCLGAAEWLLALQTRLEGVRAEQRDNLLWQAAATAPAGFCHVRSNTLGTLLADLVEGLSFEDVRQRFGAKVDPENYQRPKAPPAEGNIDAAERVFEKLGLAPALARRFARLSDLRLLWSPAPASSGSTAPTGVFGQLRAKTASPVATRVAGVPPTTITWEKFARLVLPDAARIQYEVLRTAQPFFALVTAADSSAPPLLQWDDPDDRNPVSWYTRRIDKDDPEGTPLLPRTWNLTPGYVDVTGITLAPNLWRDGLPRNHGRKAFLLLDGCREIDYEKGGGFFVSRLRSDLHGVRATLEAYANDAVVGGKDEGEGFGIGLQEGVKWSCRLRVTGKNGLDTDYLLDRWD